MIEFNQLAKTYYEGFFRKAVQAVRDVSFVVEKGSIYGYLGPNGSGKSTTLKMLMGLLFPTNGSVTIMGENSTKPSARKNTGFLPELPYFFDYLTGSETLKFYGKLAGLNNNQIKKNSEMLLDIIKLDKNWLDKKVKSYSKGMVQKLGLVQSVLHMPELVVWDEPMSGLDPLGRMEVQNLLRALHSNGSTVFYSSHVLSDVEAICSHIAIIHKGTIKTSGPMDVIMQNTQKEITVKLKNGPKELPESFTGVWNESQHKYSCKDEEDKNEFLKWCLSSGLEIQSLKESQQSLEELFSNLVGDTHA